MATVKITLGELKRMIREENSKLRGLGTMKDVSDVSADEVDAAGYGEALEHQVDWAKALDIKEQRLLDRLREVRRRRRQLGA